MSQIVSDVTDILDYKKEKQQAASSRKKILQQMAEDQKTKTNLIKKALATQRAKYGADGMTGRGMTEEAVLKRLRDDTAQPYEEKRLANLEKIKSIRVSRPNILKSLLARFDDIVG